MTDILIRAVPCRWMHHVDGNAAHAVDGLLELKWLPDDPFAVHLHADMPSSVMDAVIDVAVFHNTMTVSANGKFTFMVAGCPVAVAYSKPALFGVRVDMADGSRLVGAVAPFAVPQVAAFHQRMSKTIEDGSGLIAEIVDAELELFIAGYAKPFEATDEGDK